MPCTAKKTFAATAATGNALLVRVKANQPGRHDAVTQLCAEREPSGRLETVDRGRHGRQEHRRVEVFAVADQPPPEWRGTIACAARVSRLSWCKDTRAGLWRPRREVAYYVSQVRLDAENFGRAVRAHWGIENRDHHVRDRTLREDASRIRRQPGVFARLRPPPRGGPRPDPAPARRLPPPALVRAQHPARERGHQRERGGLHQRPQPRPAPHPRPAQVTELNSPGLTCPRPAGQSL